MTLAVVAAVVAAAARVKRTEMLGAVAGLGVYVVRYAVPFGSAGE
ncbi:hypothetical protein [Streptomyces sp. NPDC052015]